MKVLNIHRRTIPQPKSAVLKLLSTLGSEDDQVWPLEKWPPMRFKNGLEEGAIGGHGPIRYQVLQHSPTGFIAFKFLGPKGFEGTHSFEVTERQEYSTEIKHSITMETSGLATLQWVLAISSLHDALLEDAFDKVENHFTRGNKKTPWSLWVRILRRILR